MSLIGDQEKLHRELTHLERVIAHIEKRLVLCDDVDCRQCGRQHRQHVEMPQDLQDLEPLQLIDPSNTGEDLFEVVTLGLYPKYLYRLQVPEIGTRRKFSDVVRFSDPVKAGRCVLFRTNLVAQRFERWEIEMGFMVFCPELRQRMKELVNGAKKLSRQARDALKSVPLYLRRHESFKCGSCYFDDVVCCHLMVERDRARMRCLENFECIAQDLTNLELHMLL